MKIWEAILKTVEPYPVGHEFGLLKRGFKYTDENGEIVETGLVEMVRMLTGKLISDGTITRRLREFVFEKKYDNGGRVFRWKVVRHGWYQITENKKPEVTLEEDVNHQPQRVWFEPVERDGKFCLF
jgi:hypothetical protein